MFINIHRGLHAEVTVLRIGPCEPDARYVVVYRYLLPRKTQYKYYIYAISFVCVGYILYLYTFRYPRAEFQYIYKYIFI